MLKNFFKITFRNLLRNKIYSFINILGLSTGVASFILIFLFVNDEVTFDLFNKNADRIFRINAHYKVGENRFNLANSPVPLAAALATDYPEIKKTVRVVKETGVYVKKGSDFIKEENFFYADSTLFDIFTIEFLSGNPKTALTQPNSVVITSKTSGKYFPDHNPVGERIILSNGKEFLITGVVKPVPKNSHLEFDFVASLNSSKVSEETNWFGEFVHTYVLTGKGVTARELNSKIYAVAEKNVGPFIKGAFGISYAEFLKSGNDFSFVFVPLKSLHLYSEVFNEFKEPGSINTIYLFSAIAVFILIIACINFINLATAKSTKRANEVGVRKVLGSTRSQLVKQFLSESIILCFVAVTISLMITEVVLKYFNDLTGKELYVDYLGTIWVIPGLLLFSILLGTAAGIYPALLLASFKPVLVLKGKLFKGNNKSMLRKGLVVFQFATSIILFIGTLVIYNQMEYVKHKNLGFNKEQVLVVKNMEDFGNQQFAFTNTIRKNSNILNASLSRGLPDYDLNANIYRKEGESRENHTLVTLGVDYDFLDTYKIQMKEGRYFSKDISTDTLAIVINEAAVKKLNYKNPLNSRLLTNLGIGSNASALNIIGIVKDFHLQSLKDEIRPAAMVLLRTQPATMLSVKISPHNAQETIKYLSEQWAQFGQSKPIEYSFFDENFGELYSSEIQTGKIFTIFALLAIVIACLGLFGLSAFTAEQRTKEIGIRKVLGSSVLQIILLLSKEFIKWVIISNIIAWPVAYFIMNGWLQDFAYRINIGLSTFLLTGSAALIIAVLTISYQAIKAAMTNPAKILKTE